MSRTRPQPLPCKTMTEAQAFAAAVSTLRTRGFLLRNEVREAMFAAVRNLPDEPDTVTLQTAITEAENALDQIYNAAVRLGIKYGV